MSLKGEIRVSSDKSISHRSIMLASLAKGKTKISNFLFAEDTLHTILAFLKLGAKIQIFYRDKEISLKDAFSLLKINPLSLERETYIVVEGLNKNISEPDDVLYLGNSGTTTRLLAGILAGGVKYSVLTGDASLRSRPMKRIKIPLESMGAKVYLRKDNYLPMTIIGKNLKGISYKSPVASAQVKSCILLAGLFTKDKIKVIEPVKSRDHTERLLRFLEVSIKEDPKIEDKVFIEIYKNKDVEKYFEIIDQIFSKENKVYLGEKRNLISDKEIFIPADISSAAFFIVGALLIEGSEITLKDVLLNPTRTGIIDVLLKMNADISFDNVRVENGEIVGDLKVRYTPNLKPIEIKGSLIPRLIDEIPILSLLMIFAKGKSKVKNAKELRVKESDRISLICENLKKFGVNIEEFEDGFEVEGLSKEDILKNIENKKIFIQTFLDHRIAMTFKILEKVLNKKFEFENEDCIKTSFPSFNYYLDILENLGGEKNNE